jgi:hypothetical protein
MIENDLCKLDNWFFYLFRASAAPAAAVWPLGYDETYA